MLLPFNVEEEGARLELAKAGLNREAGHLGELAVVGVVQVNVEGHGHHRGAAQLALTEAQLQVLHLPVESQRAECGAVHIKGPCHDRRRHVGIGTALQVEAVEVLVVAVHLRHAYVIIVLQVFNSLIQFLRCLAQGYRQHPPFSIQAERALRFQRRYQVAPEGAVLGHRSQFKQVVQIHIADSRAIPGSLGEQAMAPCDETDLTQVHCRASPHESFHDVLLLLEHRRLTIEVLRILLILSVERLLKLPCHLQEHALHGLHSHLRERGIEHLHSHHAHAIGIRPCLQCRRRHHQRLPSYASQSHHVGRRCLDSELAVEVGQRVVVLADIDAHQRQRLARLGIYDAGRKGHRPFRCYVLSP